jgi:hypothetical protein
MIVGFSKHGTGGGKGPTEYVINPEREGREENPPITVRGDSELTKQLIDSLDFKWKYTSGVLSFAPDEVITPKMESEIIDRFESVAFAGLEPDQYNILWVRHSHAGHHELHFITPRVELETGKSLNIKPPGDRAREHFDDFRSEINAKYGLADPTDPDREKNIASPNHELKIAAKALRKGQKAPDNMRQLIDEVLTQRAVKGLIRSREDVLNHVKQLGLKTTREGKNYITVSDPNSEGRWRLKGGLYAQDFEPSTAIERADIARKRDYSKPDQEATRRYGARVERHISARAEYNQNRYQTPKPKRELVYDIEPAHVAIDNRSQSLDGYIRRELGNNAIFDGQDYKIGAERSDIGEKRREDRFLEVRREEPTLREDKHESGDVSRRLQNIEGVLNDGTRKPFIERLEEFRDSIQRATNSIRTRAKSIATDVQTYLVRERETESPSNKLEQASRGTEQSIEQVSNGFQKVIKQEKQAQRSGPSLGR